MSDEKWQEILDNIKEKLSILEHSKEEFEVKDDFGVKGKGEREVVVFEGPLGKMKLEREKRPLIAEKKIHYVKTKGSGAMIEYILSKDEIVSYVKCFQWDEKSNDWEKVKISGFSF